MSFNFHIYVVISRKQLKKKIKYSAYQNDFKHSTQQSTLKLMAEQRKIFEYDKTLY